MKNQRKMFVFVLILVLMFTMAGCAASTGETTTEAVSAPVTTAPVTEESTVPTEPVSSEPETQTLAPAEYDEPSEIATVGGKETAYKTGTVWLTAENGMTVYDMQFTDGELEIAYLEDDEGKGGWGGSSDFGIEHFEYYGMTVEEISGALAKDGYTITISDTKPAYWY